MSPVARDEQSRELVAEGAPMKELHLLDFLIILSRRRKFILWFTLGVTILSTITVFLLPSKYTAQTVVLPPSENSSSLASVLLGQLSGSSALASLAGSGLGIKNTGDMYVSMLRLPVVEDAVIKRFGLMARYHKKRMSDARRVFEDRTTVILGVKDGLIRISVEDRDPNMAAQIANACVDEFRKLSANLAVTEASQRRMFFQQQLLEANENLAAAEESMKSTEQSTGVLQIDSQARALIEAASTLRGQIMAKEVELQAMRAYATDDNPHMVMGEQQLEALKAQFARLAGKDTNPSSDIIPHKGSLPAVQMEYIRRLRDLRYSETVVEILAKQFEMAKLDEAREGAIIQVAEVATPPDKRSFPKRTIIIILAALLAAFAACGWCIFAAGFERLRSNPDERRRLEILRATFR